MAKVKPQIEEVVIVKLSEIGLSFENCRYSVDDAAEDEGKTEQLAANILVNGQETPLLLRYSHETGRGAKPYDLVCGRRRYTALGMLSKAGKHTAQVKAIIRDMSDAEAAIANAYENTSRNKLTTPDAAFAALRIKRSLDAETGRKVTSTEVAQAMGVSQGWANRLLATEPLSPEAFELWRRFPGKVSLDDIGKIVKKPKAKHLEAVQRKVEGSGNGSNGSGNGSGNGSNTDPAQGLSDRGKTAWRKAAVKQAEAAGAMVGKLVSAGCIQPGEFEWPADLAEIVSPRFSENSTDAAAADIRKRCADAFSQAYDKACEAAPQSGPTVASTARKGGSAEAVAAAAAPPAPAAAVRRRNRRSR